jgi:hypothetical protein
MSSQQNSNRVVNLGDYRAALAARRAQAVPPPAYLLWYPGLGYVQVDPSVKAVAVAGLPVSRHPPSY